MQIAKSVLPGSDEDLTPNSSESGSDSGDEEFGDEQAPEPEAEAHEIIADELTSCSRCGPEVFCKISADGKHLPVPHHLIGLWSRLMVRLHPSKRTALG